MSNSILISSRVRLARNLADAKFVTMLSKKEKEEVKERIHEHIKKDNPFMLDYIDMESLDPAHTGALIEDHTISPEFAENKEGEALLVNHSERISVMINEEDHLRIQALSSDGDLEALYEKAKKVDDWFDGAFPYAFSEKFGYLTCCPTNLGTALRVSVMVHLPALTESGKIGEVSSSLSKIGVTFRGLYGEGSKAYGNIYQISNSVSLGVSEKEIIGLIKRTLSQLEKSEKEMRKKLLENPAIEDRIFRSYGILTNARMISSKEATALLSDLRMGAAEGLFDISTEKIDSLETRIQPYNMSLTADSGDERTRDAARAETLRKEISAR